jgi:hypothetical protein
VEYSVYGHTRHAHRVSIDTTDGDEADKSEHTPSIILPSHANDSMSPPIVDAHHDEPRSHNPSVDGTSIFANVEAEDIPQVAEEYFRADVYDARWARNAASDLRRQLTPDDTLAAQVRSVECRSTVCKVVVDYPNQATQADYLKKVILGNTQISMPSYSHLIQNNEGVATETYFYRDKMP